MEEDAITYMLYMYMCVYVRDTNIILCISFIVILRYLLSVSCNKEFLQKYFSQDSFSIKAITETSRGLLISVLLIK